jgi:hypothetical protein
MEGFEKVSGRRPEEGELSPSPAVLNGHAKEE